MTACWLLALLVTAGAVRAQDPSPTIYSGYIDATTPSKSFPVKLEAGQSILMTTEALDGDLDTVLALVSPSGVTVAENDDRSGDALDSAVGYTALESGIYAAVVRRYDQSDTSGHFELSITVGPESILARLEDITRVQFSGPPHTRDTAHFRVHYTLEGPDATSELMVSALARSVEEIYRIQIDRMGWQPPPSDGFRGGNALYDVYIADLFGQGEDALGYTKPEDMVGDNAATPLVENGSTSYIVLENDFDLPLDSSDAIRFMRTTMSHEFNHAIQFGYDVGDMRWYYEATATWIETTALKKDEDASGYVEYVYNYPELCFGTGGEETEGLAVYGQWLFVQALVDVHGPEAVRLLWENVAAYDGFLALEETLAHHGASLPSAVANYHVQNLIRSYELAPAFHVTVYRENTVDAPGRWTFSGLGVQELGANYYAVQLDPGTYYAGLINDDGLLELWGIGVRGAEADAFALGRGGTINPAGYDHFYLMVFNPAFDDDVDDCTYYDYSLELTGSKGAPAPVYRVWNANHFEPLR